MKLAGNPTGWLLVVWVALSCHIAAVAKPCDAVHAMAKMAEAKNGAELVRWKQRAGDSYRAKLVYSFRKFELNPSDRSVASSALALIPKDKQQDSTWHDGVSLLCPDETDEDLSALGKLQMRLPHDLARAVLLVPNQMQAYVKYAYTSIADPNSDYAVRMQAVCRKEHRAFLNAVAALSPYDKKWFDTIFETKRCRALKFPEQ